MTYQAYEESTFNGAPLELFWFVAGTNSYRYTNGVSEVVKDGAVFLPLPISRGAMRQDAGAEAAALTTIVLPQSSEIAALFGAFLPAKPVGVTIFRRHLTDPDAQFIPIMIGSVASHTFEEDTLNLSVYTLLGALRRRVPWLTYQRNCNWPLYGVGCGASKAAYRLFGVANGVSGLTISASVFGSQASGWLQNGWVERDNTGESRFITSHTGSDITVQSPFPDLAIGEPLTAYAGCDRTMATCEAKFNNLDRHAGWPDVPQKNPYRDNVYGNAGTSRSRAGGGSTPSGAGWRAY
jgi:uncharacterized phage protein (TIGR02218 family)